MFEMFRHAVTLFFRGKLFRDHRAVFRQWLIAFAISVVLVLGVGWVASPVAGVVVASVVGGMLQPYLFKDVKFA
jgi:hypothetical protein